MAEEPSVVDAEQRRILAVRKKIRWTEIGKVAIPSLDEVWKHIRGNEITGFGHNVFIYRGMSVLGVEASFGVEVPESVEAPKGFVIDYTPAGKAATFHQYGDYSKLIDTIIDEGFELRPRRRHVHLHAQRLDDQTFLTRNGDSVSRGGEGLDGHWVLALCWKNQP